MQKWYYRQIFLKKKLKKRRYFWHFFIGKQERRKQRRDWLVGKEGRTSFCCCCSWMALLNFHLSTPPSHFSNSPSSSSSLSKSPSLSLLPTCSISCKNPSKFFIIHGTRNSGLFRIRAMTPSFGSRLEETVRKTVADNPVVVYSKSWCSWVPHLLFLYLCLCFGVKGWIFLVIRNLVCLIFDDHYVCVCVFLFFASVTLSLNFFFWCFEIGFFGYLMSKSSIW